MENRQTGKSEVNMIKFYLKMFFINFILAAVLVFMASLGSGAAAALADAVYLGVQFGLLMALSAGSLHVAMAKRYARRATVADPYSTTQALELNVSMPYEKLFELCLRYVTDTAGYTVSASDPGKGLITARTPLTWKGPGSVFSINFSGINDGSAKVRISSRPRINHLILDYGNNLGNVLRARDYIQTNALPEKFS